MKVFVLLAIESDYEYSNTTVLGVFREGDFCRFMGLINSHISDRSKKFLMNSNVFNINNLEKDFNKITEALNCKENQIWDSLYLGKYTKNLDALSSFYKEDSLVVECHWLCEEK